MDLDIRTLAVLTALVTAGLSVGLYGFWFKDRSSRAMLLFAVAFSLEAVGFGALAFRHLLDPMATIIFANDAIGMGHLVLVFGAATLVGKRTPLWIGTVLFIGHTALFLHFTYVDSDIVARIVTISAFVGISNAWAAFLLFRWAKDTPAPFARQVMGGVFAASALHMLVRIILTIHSAKVVDFMSAGQLQALAFLIVSFTLCAVALCAKWAVFADAIAHKENALKQLNSKIADYESLSSVLAHDLRAPAIRTSSVLEILREEHKSVRDDSYLEWIGHAENAVRQLISMLDSIMAHHTLGRRQPGCDVSTEGAAMAAYTNVSAEIEAGDATIVVARNIPPVHANESDLIRIFQNLFQNAIKYRHPDRVPSIKVTGHLKSDTVEIRVADNGAGVPVNHREKIFGMFSRLDRETATGHGIGLACCRRMIEALEGHIHVEPNGREDEGSVFVIALPQAKVTRHFDKTSDPRFSLSSGNHLHASAAIGTA